MGQDSSPSQGRGMGPRLLVMACQSAPLPCKFRPAVRNRGDAPPREVLCIMCLTAEEGAWSSHIYAAEALRKREINSERQAHTIGRREKIASFTSKGIEFCTGTRENLHLFRRFRHSRHPPHLLAGFPPIWRSDPDTIPSPEPLPVNTPPRPTRRKTPLVSRLPLPSPCPYGRRCVGVPVSGTQIEESRWSSAGTKEGGSVALAPWQPWTLPTCR